MRSKKILYVILALSSLSYIVSCARDELDLTAESDSGFTQCAREYFEENASDLQLPKVGSFAEVQSRNLNLSSYIVTPVWDKVNVSENEYFSTAEVPLEGDIFLSGAYASKESGKKYANLPARVCMALVVQRSNLSGEFRSFVVTLVGSNNNPKAKGLSFIRNRLYNGVEIISDLEGNYLYSSQFVRGDKRRVILARAAGYEQIDTTTISGRLSLSTVSSTHSFSRSGESEDTEPPIPGGCPLCGSRYCDGSCEVVVTYCRECNRPVDECRCCSECGHYPCDCPLEWTCPKCGSRYCDGDCQQTPGGNVTDPEEPEDPILVTLSVDVSSTTMTLGNSYQISVQVSPEDAPIERIDLDAINSINQVAGLGNPSHDRAWTIKALRPGKYTIQATAFGDNIQCNTATRDIEVRFPNAEEIKNNPTVRAALDNAWQATLNSANATTCCEYGGGIYIKVDNAGNCSYVVQQIKGNDYPYQSEDIPITFDVETGYKGSIDQGGEYLVAAYHTHPRFSKSQDFAKRFVGPSSVDLQNVSDYPCFVYDVVGVFQPGETVRTHSSTDTSGLATEIYTYGPSVRSY